MRSLTEQIADATKPRTHLLMIVPPATSANVPVIDDITRKMTAAWRHRRDSDYSWRGFHVCVCGVASDNRDHWVGTDDLLTNSLCIHYLAFHRPHVPADELEKVRALNCGEEDPTEAELHQPRRPEAVFQPRRSYVEEAVDNLAKAIDAQALEQALARSRT